jgi:hypothetical protein
MPRLPVVDRHPGAGRDLAEAGLRRGDEALKGELRMHIVEQTKFLVGVLLAVIGIGILISSRGTRGFGQRKQAGVLLLVAAAVFIAIGLGYDPRALLRQ